MQFDTDIEAMKKLYGTHGYMAVNIQPDVKWTTRTPASNMCCTSRRETSTLWGIWTFGASTRALPRACRMTGSCAEAITYDSSYPKRFLEQADKEISIMADWKTSVRESLNRDEKTVDVTLRFDPKS